jgi:hypothetical protein
MPLLVKIRFIGLDLILKFTQYRDAFLGILMNLESIEGQIWGQKKKPPLYARALVY